MTGVPVLCPIETEVILRKTATVILVRLHDHSNDPFIVVPGQGQFYQVLKHRQKP